MPTISFKLDEARAVRTLVFDWLTELQDQESELEARLESGEDTREVRDGLAHLGPRVEWVNHIALKLTNAIYRPDTRPASPAVCPPPEEEK